MHQCACFCMCMCLPDEEDMVTHIPFFLGLLPLPSAQFWNSTSVLSLHLQTNRMLTALIESRAAPANVYETPQQTHLTSCPGCPMERPIHHSVGPSESWGDTIRKRDERGLENMFAFFLWKSSPEWSESLNFFHKWSFRCSPWPVLRLFLSPPFVSSPHKAQHHKEKLQPRHFFLLPACGGTRAQERPHMKYILACL